MRDTDFKVNAVSPPSTATDFNHHLGTSTVETAAQHILKYTLIGNDGPTGGQAREAEPVYDEHGDDDADDGVLTEDDVEEEGI